MQEQPEEETEQYEGARGEPDLAFHSPHGPWPGAAGGAHDQRRAAQRAARRSSARLRVPWTRLLDVE
ncbi:hypothetical protein [Streptomyces yangpuensis]|uniref:hypothetical protein n=1 Tax=Streptomyces yangpuensis TaxID=1648182 RepID=UPI0036A55D54